jgi:murein DD-endopeptidase MepM/ murein hydrolase activator NlpD
VSWNDIMRRVLPPIRDEELRWNVKPHVTSSYGDTNRPKGSTNPHRGVDFNYVGEQASEFNEGYPTIRSPVDGTVTNAGQGNYGTIAIRDANGFSHEILHTHTRHVAVGDPVVAGQSIGTMGNTGVKDRNGNPGPQHVHYQLKDPAGTVIDPPAVTGISEVRSIPLRPRRPLSETIGDI